MIARYVAPVRCIYTREQAVLAYWMALDSLGVKPTVPLTSVLVAHGALECGNFAAGLWNCNVGNIKASDVWDREYTCITVNEILQGKDGKYRERWFSPQGELTGRGGKLLNEPLPVPPGHPQTRMRAYGSLDEGVADKIRFLLKPLWAESLEFAKRGDASGYVRAIRARRYFTAYAGEPNPTPYETSVIKLVGTYRPIVQQIADGKAHELNLAPAKVQIVNDGSAQRTNLLEPEEVARIEMMQALWFDEQMHPSDDEGGSVA